MADTWIQQCQIWLNAQYSSQPGYVPAPETGVTGWGTMYALTRALQIELGIAAPSNTFGAGTSGSFTAQVGTINALTASTHPNIIGILRSALWCKGYSGGYNAPPGLAPFLQWSSEIAASVNQVRTDLGLSGGGIDAKLMKSLLTMDAYVTLPGGTPTVRLIQQWMNGRYVNRANYPLVPCDGLYTRQVQKGMMYGLQYEIGMTDAVANGNFGPGTQQGIRDHGAIGLGDVDGPRKMVSLFQAALIFNGYTGAPFTGAFNLASKTQMNAFQEFVGLGSTADANYSTWASLLVSTGDPDRPVSAADTATEITAARASALYAAGVRTVGRYINGTTKRLQWTELANLAAAGIEWFPIYQEFNNDPVWFSYLQGNVQGQRLIARARGIGIPSGSLVFLSVDYDATDSDITSIVIPHFRGAHDAMANDGEYTLRLGIYGTRNVCSRVTSAGYAEGSFIADMSTGWSGNLGFSLPQAWMYDQIKTVTVGSGAGAILVDRVAASSRAESLGPQALSPTPVKYLGAVPVAWADMTWWRWAALFHISETLVEQSSQTVMIRNEVLLHALQRPTYWTGSGPLMNGAWQTLFTPMIHFRLALPEEQIQQIANYTDRVLSYVGNQVFPIPEDGPIGDVAHFAAVTRSYTNLGIPTAGDGTKLVDLAAWAGDLATAWEDYEETRVAQGGLLDAYTWLRAHIGGTTLSPSGRNQFGEGDLRADAWGYVVAARMQEDQTVPLEDILGDLLIRTNSDPGFVLRAFRDGRFGSARTRAIEIAATVFTAVIVQFPVGQLAGPRLPGADAPGAPPDFVLATEQEALATAFVDVLWDAVSSWTQRS